MNGIGVRNFSSGDQAGNTQVAFFARRGADADGFIRKTNMQRIPVGFRVDRDSPHSEFTARADHAECNFTTIRYKNFLEQTNPS